MAVDRALLPHDDPSAYRSLYLQASDPEKILL
jgi:hypothetical protein